MGLQVLLVDELPIEFHFVLSLQDRSRNVNGIASVASGWVDDGITFCFVILRSFPQYKYDCGLQPSLCTSNCAAQSLHIELSWLRRGCFLLWLHIGSPTPDRPRAALCFLWFGAMLSAVICHHLHANNFPSKNPWKSVFFGPGIEIRFWTNNFRRRCA